MRVQDFLGIASLHLDGEWLRIRWPIGAPKHELRVKPSMGPEALRDLFQGKHPSSRGTAK